MSTRTLRRAVDSKVSVLAVPTRRLLTLSVALVLAAVVVALASAAGNGASWTMSGQDITNWRYQPNETKLSVRTAGTLSVKWAAQLGGEISATPAVVDGVAYVPDWGGHLNAVDTATGNIIWQKSIKDLAGASTALTEDVATQTVVPDPNPVQSRTSPAVSGSTLLIGTQTMRSTSGQDGARLVAVNKTTGATLWSTRLDDHPLSIITQSPTIYAGKIYVGVASIEENGVDCGGPDVGGHHACYFRGSLSRVDLKTGQVEWKTYMITDAQLAAGYAGAAVWGSSPAIDTKRKSVYIGTGNNYAASQVTSDCVQDVYDDAAPDDPDPQDIFACEDTYGVGNNVDALVSLDINTGAIKWLNKLQGFDAWTTACIGLPTACPSPNGPDFDFGQGPMLIPTAAGDIVAGGQKSGIMWGLNAQTGAVVWKTVVGPGSSLGGLEWGSATDGKRIYFAEVNLGFLPYPIVNPPDGTPGFWFAGSWGAIDVATGQIVWQRADLNPSIDLGPVSVANGVMYASSFGDFAGASLPTMFAFDAATGHQLWSYVSGGSVNAGPAIVDGTLYWGSGYTRLFFGGTNNKLFAFSRS